MPCDNIIDYSVSGLLQQIMVNEKSNIGNVPTAASVARDMM